MDHIYVNGDIVGFKVEATNGAHRKKGTKHRPEVCPTRLVTRTMSEGQWLRDLGERRWQNTKGGKEFHATFLSIINHLVRQDHHGVILSYDQGQRGSTRPVKPPILPHPFPSTTVEQAEMLSKFVGEWGYHYSAAETFTYNQTVPMLNWLATIVSRDPQMRDLIERAHSVTA